MVGGDNRLQTGELHQVRGDTGGTELWDKDLADGPMTDQIPILRSQLPAMQDALSIPGSCTYRIFDIRQALQDGGETILGTTPLSPVQEVPLVIYWTAPQHPHRRLVSHPVHARHGAETCIRQPGRNTDSQRVDRPYAFGQRGLIFRLGGWCGREHRYCTDSRSEWINT